MHALTTRRPWTADEDETVRINFPMWPAFLIGHLINRSTSSVYQRAKALKVVKCPDHWRNPMAHLWNGTGHPNSIASRIKPGSVPSNKGLRRPAGWAPGRMAQTQFLAGRPAHENANYKPIGSLRVSRDGDLERKVTDDRDIVPARRWVGVHRLVWEATHGPIPPGYVVRFRSGMKTIDPELITLDRLELISQAENMRRNTIHNYPEHLKKVMRLRGVLNRRINRISKTRTAP
ncbi:HNH endonuclease [Xanthomonas campestris pv. trichodesmae]|uniref:HNH endonuclease n=2 Tax=Xanthomonas citri TaxID=346 RepID=A0AB33C9A2_XANCI|nr:HNH endonuclease signature motif containing protein [Xanthomonas citri]ASK91082.1 HNH endonuclease [Xanthomonas citri pv. vignicola]MBV6779246.1 HNH endonuclease [Xanthomonas campestris pv. trichodesmae]MBZ3921760.1 hypothetical protein [Xanthomonas campestris pv. trichodesmae]MBZ3926360.1 hypothetical protein [Xanthomonas citri pv. sesbaniae]